MTEPTLPSSGGAWLREKDGTLRLVEEPTVYEGPAPEAVEAAVEGTVEEPVKAPAKPTRKEA